MTSVCGNFAPTAAAPTPIPSRLRKSRREIIIPPLLLMIPYSTTFGVGITQTCLSCYTAPERHFSPGSATTAPHYFRRLSSVRRGAASRSSRSRLLPAECPTNSGSGRGIHSVHPSDRQAAKECPDGPPPLPANWPVHYRDTFW